MLTSNVLVIGRRGSSGDFRCHRQPYRVRLGFNQDGLLYIAMAFSSGDESKFPVVAVMALHPPLDFANNSTIITDGYEIDLDEGSGPGVVNRDAMVGMDVDDPG